MSSLIGIGKSFWNFSVLEALDCPACPVHFSERRRDLKGTAASCWTLGMVQFAFNAVMLSFVENSTTA